MNETKLLVRNGYRRTVTGFTLVEMAVVLMIIAILLTFVLPTNTAVRDNNKRELTIQKIKNIDTAIVNYVMVNKRLPCPADGTSTTGIELRDATSGDCTGVTSTQQTGVLPWVTLGIAQDDVIDGWNNLLTYRVAFGLSRDNMLSMSACDPVGTAQATTTLGVNVSIPAGTTINESICNSVVDCTGVGTTCTNPIRYLEHKGFGIVDGGGSLIMDPTQSTGAAYVVISHGGNGVGAYTNTQVYISDPIKGVDGTLEALNHNNIAINTLDITASRFRDANISEGAANIYFDDIISRPSLLSLIQTAQLGPRSH